MTVVRSASMSPGHIVAVTERHGSIPDRWRYILMVRLVPPGNLAPYWHSHTDWMPLEEVVAELTKQRLSGHVQEIVWPDGAKP